MLLSLQAASADVVHLRDGRTIRADACRESDGEILCRKAGGVVGIPVEHVERIESIGAGRTPPLRPFRPRRSQPREDGAPPSVSPPMVLISDRTASVIPEGPEAWQARIAELEDSLNRPGVREEEVRREIAVLYTVIGNDAAESGDFDAAEAGYSRATDNDPNLASPRMNLARIRLQQGRNYEAETIVQDLAYQRPDDPAVLALLGEIAYRKGSPGEAIEHWTRSLELRPDPAIEEKLRKASREDRVEEGFFRADGTHFTVKYDGERASDELSGEILDHLERTYDELTGRFNVYPSSVIIVTLYSREAFHDVTESPEWVGGVFDGQIRIPVGGLTRLTRVARSVFTHELAHCIVYHKARGHSPKWLQEGIAQWVEGKSARHHRGTLASQLSGATAEDAARQFSYPQALSMVERFLSTWTFSHLLDLLDALGRGQDFEAAFSEVTGQTFHEFLEGWLRDLHSPGGRL